MVLKLDGYDIQKISVLQEIRMEYQESDDNLERRNNEKIMEINLTIMDINCSGKKITLNVK